MSMEKETVNDGLEQKTDDVTVETATEQKDAAAAASAEQGAVETPVKKSKKKYIIAAVIAVLLVAVGAAAANYDTLSNFIRSKGSPESYYRYIAKKDRDKAVDKVVKSYNAMTKSIKLNDQQKKSTIKVEAGDALKPMLSSVGLESMEIETNAKVKDKVATSKSVLKVNGKDAMSYNLYADYKDGKVYMQIPELSDAYLDYSNLGDVDGQVNYVKAAGAVMDKVPDGDTLENVLTTYSDIVYDNLTGVTKKNQTVKVEGISKECTVLTAKADSKKVCDIAAKMAKQLKKDKDIKAIIEKADKSAYTQFKDGVSEFEKELAAEDASKENINLEAALYVDKSGEVVGRTYSAKTEDGNTIEIRSFLPKKGNKFGYELSFVVDKTEYAKLSGKGEMKSGKVNAKLYASVDASLLEDVSKEYITDGEKFLSIEVKNMDVQALEKGSCKGEIIIKVDENKMPAFALYSLDWTFEGDTKKARSEIKVLSGSSAMVTLNIASEDGEDPKVSAPAADAKIYDFADENAINEYAENIDLITFLTTLKQNCGLDLTSLLLGAMQ